MSMKKLLDYLKSNLKFSFVIEDLRKIGTNCVTAGLIGLFVNNVSHLTNMVIKGSLAIILIGFISLMCCWIGGK